MTDNLWIWIQIILIATAFIGVPAAVFFLLMNLIDRRVLSPKQRRRTNGSLLAHHIGNVRN